MHDPKCRDLADTFLADYDITGTRTREELATSLANEIQGAIEGWLEDAESEAAIREAIRSPR